MLISTYLEVEKCPNQRKLKSTLKVFKPFTYVLAWKEIENAKKLGKISYKFIKKNTILKTQNGYKKIYNIDVIHIEINNTVREPTIALLNKTKGNTFHFNGSSRFASEIVSIHNSILSRKILIAFPTLMFVFFYITVHEETVF